MRMRVRSMVGLIPLFAVDTIEPEMIDKLPGFKRRMDWFTTQSARTCAATSRRCRGRAWSSGGCSAW